VGLKRSAKESKHAGEKWINPVFESHMRSRGNVDGRDSELQYACDPTEMPPRSKWRALST